MSMNRFDYLWLKWRGIAWLVLGRHGAALDIFDDMVAHCPDNG
jgi:hypothetical protein